MLERFPRLSRFATKVLEIAGAGCASALAAIVLGNAREPPRQPAPPAVVRLAPADEQMIKHVRDESVALAEQLRSASDARNGAAIVLRAAAATTKPAKAAAGAPVRREQKTARAQPIDLKQRAGESLPIQSAMASAGPEGAHGPAGITGAASDAREGQTTPAATAAPVAAAPVAAAPVAAAPVAAAPVAAAPVAAAPAAPIELGPSLTQTQVPSRLWPAAASSLRDAPRPPLGVGAYPSSSM